MSARHIAPRSAPRIVRVVLSTLTLAACARCGGEPGSDSITILSYNLQTLFDPVDQGGEYEGFSVVEGEWSERAYKSRLAALASGIVSAVGGAGPEVVVVQEAENLRVLRDLAAEAGGYPYALASPDEESALACGILSRLPVLAFRAHRVRSPEGGPPSVPRLVLEAELGVEGRSLVVLATHWKSKLGGAEETEEERRRAAAFVGALAAVRLAERPGLALVVAGDLNTNPDEYERVGGAYPTALMRAGAGDGPWLLIGRRDELSSPGARPLVLYEPWLDADGYSYRYDGEDERIDHLLLSPALAEGTGCAWRLERFSAEPPDFLVSAEGTPLRWDSRTGSGYSDHLPISIRLSPSP